MLAAVELDCSQLYVASCLLLYLILLSIPFVQPLLPLQAKWYDLSIWAQDVCPSATKQTCHLIKFKAPNFNKP